MNVSLHKSTSFVFRQKIKNYILRINLQIFFAIKHTSPSFFNTSIQSESYARKIPPYQLAIIAISQTSFRSK